MSDDPAVSAAARSFLDAIVDGDHPMVWDLLHPDARERAIGLALRRGLDRVKAQRFVHGNADPSELAEFQRDVLRGLRRDFRSVELERLTVGAPAPVDDVTGSEPADMTVDLASPSNLPGTAGWYAGRLRLRRLDLDGWRVLDVEPTVAGP